MRSFSDSESRMPVRSNPTTSPSRENVSSRTGQISSRSARLRSTRAIAGADHRHHRWRRRARQSLSNCARRDRGVRVLAHDLLDAVGLDRRQRLVRAVEQGGQPVRQPSRAAIVHLGPKRVEAGGLSSLQRCIAAPIGADRHLHTKAVIKDEDPRACSTGLGHEESGKDGFARSGPSHDQGMAAGRFFIRTSLLVIGEPISALLRRGQHGDHLAPRHVTLPLCRVVCGGTLQNPQSCGW